MDEFSLNDVYKLKDKRHEDRAPVLEKMGFVFTDHSGYWEIKGVYGMWWETVVNQDDEEFKKHLSDIQKLIDTKNAV